MGALTAVLFMCLVLSSCWVLRSKARPTNLRSVYMSSFVTVLLILLLVVVCICWKLSCVFWCRFWRYWFVVWVYFCMFCFVCFCVLMLVCVACMCESESRLCWCYVALQYMYTHTIFTCSSIAHTCDGPGFDSTSSAKQYLC